MDHVFRDIKPSKKSVELKEEILQNLVDKYHDLLAEGKTPEAAYNIAIASIGDTEELLSSLRENGVQGSTISAEKMEQGRRKSALLTTVAVMMYILSVLPPILMTGTKYEETLAPALMLCIIAAATGLVIYGQMSKLRYRKVDDSIVEEFKEWQNQTDSDRRAFRAISSAMWSLITVIYIVVSFTTMAWHITWVIFLIGAAIEGIIKAVFELKRQG